MRERFSPQEWEIVKQAPFMVFNLVAGADGFVDARERAQLLRSIRDRYLDRPDGGSDESPDPTLPHFHLPWQEMFEEIVASDVGELMERAHDPAALEVEAVRLRDLLGSKLRDEEYHRLVEDLFRLGVEIAQASGGGFLGWGNPISDEERLALEGFARALGLRSEFLEWARRAG